MAPPRFIADCNVGRLARWLRALGYDAEYVSRIDDARLVALAQAGGRVLLTRDLDLTHRRAVASGAVRAVLLSNDRVEEQLRQVMAELGLNTELALSRCLECNVVLQPRSAHQVASRLPPHVRATQTRFSECPRCSRVYWPGSHWARMRARLAAL